MNTVLEQMLQPYHAQTLYEQKNAMKEVMQEIVLCGLSRAGFFKEAAFYGGTALRIFYGLDRFSEDLDFSLESANTEFDLAAYLPTLEKEVRAFGCNVQITEKKKIGESNIHPAFLKANTKELLLQFYAGEAVSGGIAANDSLKIKLEIDVDPPRYATFERRYRLQPAPYEIKLYDAPSLFAGKIHAVLCRAWKTRVKGRDLYDYVFYLSRGISVNRKHLCERLVQSGYLVQDASCTLEEIKKMLCERFASIDYEQAKQDVQPFIRDVSALNLWSAEFFRQITNELTEK